MISTEQKCYNSIQELLAEIDSDRASNKRLVSCLLECSDRIEARIEDQANSEEEESVGDEVI